MTQVNETLVQAMEAAAQVVKAAFRPWKQMICARIPAFLRMPTLFPPIPITPQGHDLALAAAVMRSASIFFKALAGEIETSPARFSAIGR
ncbi:MAG: hypothetical protein EXS35_00980 [Pedosphaera sp.]|nr:hypothetical protein [Pedosphaera sp.]